MFSKTPVRNANGDKRPYASGGSLHIIMLKRAET